VYNVSAATLSGPNTVTVSWTNSIEPGVVFFAPQGYVARSYSVFRFTMNQTPDGKHPVSNLDPNTSDPNKIGFRPRDSADPAANCSSHYGDCFPMYTAQFSDPNFSAPIQFALSLPTGKQDLPGSSTNSAPNAAQGATAHADTPDYVFEASQNNGFTINSNRQIQTPAAVNQATATVSSWDYGGVANLTATAILQGVTLVQPQADIVYYTTTGTPNPQNPAASYATDQNQTYQVDQFVNPPSCAGSGSFASLPIDTDCNGIADGWEGQ
jgi:hypothetical protein